MQVALLPFLRYFDFNGRSRRAEFWLFLLLIGIVVFVLAELERMLGLVVNYDAVSADPSGLSSYEVHIHAGYLTGLFLLATIIPYIAVAVRRLHDRDRTGWWLLIGFVPLIGAITLLVFFVRRGTVGPNRFGPDPLQSA